MRALVIILILTFPVAVHAEEYCQPQDYDSEDQPDFDCPGPEEGLLVPRLNPPPSIPVVEGESLSAPWEGALVHRDRLLRMGTTITAIRRLRWNDRVRLLTEYQILLSYNSDICDANANHAQAEIEFYREALDTANERVQSSRAWHKSWWFGFTVGIVSAGALVALTAYALMAI